MNTPQTYHLHLATMRCASCVTRVDKALRAVPGIDNVRINPVNKIVSVTTATPDLDTVLITILAAAGYRAELVGDAS